MRKVLYALALTTAGVSASFSAVPASAQDFSASRVITNFDEDNLRAVMTKLGGTVEPGSEGGYLIKFSNGTAATATFTVCGSGKCFGMNLTGGFGKPSDKSIAETERLVTDYNQRWNAAKAYSRGEGQSTVQHYMIADGGITMENYRAQLSVYSGMLEKTRETIYTEG